MKNKIIGIDPDIDKSGVCYLYTPTKQVEVSTMDFPHLLEYLSTFEADCNVVVVVEASWVTRHNWHGKWGDNNRIMAAKGYDVGRNHELGQLIVQMCKYWKIPVVEKAPLKKMWRGRDGKITHDEMMNIFKTNGYTPMLKRSNQEERDSFLISISYHGQN